MAGRIDSFDESFLAMHGLFPFADSFDRAFALACKVGREYREVYLWGPEAALLRNALLREWRRLAGPILQKIHDAFDTDGDITVDGAEVRRLLKKLDRIGEAFWEAVGVNVLAILDLTRQRALTHFQQQMRRRPKVRPRVRAKKADWPGWSDYVSDMKADHVAAYLQAYPQKTVHPEIERLVKIAETNVRVREMDRADLFKRIENVSTQWDIQLEDMSDVEVGKAWTKTGIDMATERNVETFQIVAEMDDKVCEVCFQLHGRTFSVDAVKEKLDVGGMQPFPKLEDIDNLTPEALQQMALYPPFHPNCRCDIVPLWEKLSAVPEEVLEMPQAPVEAVEEPVVEVAPQMAEVITPEAAAETLATQEQPWMGPELEAVVSEQPPAWEGPPTTIASPELVEAVPEIAEAAPAIAEVAPEVVPEIVPEAPPPIVPEAPPSVEELKKWQHVQGTQLGSNPGGKFIGPDGGTYYAKFYANVDQAKAEVLSDFLARKMGLETLEAQLVELPWEGGTRMGVVTKWKEGLRSVGKIMNEKDISSLTQLDKINITKHYLHAALTANWDVVGLDYDNLVQVARGKWMCVDYGGTLTFRARGGAKPFGFDPSEFFTLRDPAKAQQAASVFNKVIEQTLGTHPKTYTRMLNELNKYWGEIDELIWKMKPGWEAQVNTEALSQRKDALLRYIRQNFRGAEKIQRVSTAVGEVAFRTPHLQAVYEEAYERYATQFRQDLAAGRAAKDIAAGVRSRIRSEVPTVYNAMSSWLGSAQGESPNGLKLKFSQLEKTEIQMTYRRNMQPQRVQEAANKIKEEEYARARALSQAYVKEVLKKDRIVMYRGIGHEDYRTQLLNIMRTHPDAWKGMDFVLMEQPLTGWSTNIEKAKSFGRNGVVIRERVAADRIFMHKDLWDKGSYLGEYESIVEGWYNRTVRIGDWIVFRDSHGNWLEWEEAWKMIKAGLPVEIILSPVKWE